MTTEAQIQADIDNLRDRFQDTPALYRETCALLFFRYGITPTANKLYQYVRKGSMSAPAEADGFSAQDMYAAGGQGDVWHYDGTKWRRLPFPSNMDLYTVCCAGDGFVYIGAESGSVFKGRGNEWKLISRGKMSLPFRDMVWHQGKVWGTSDYGLWVVEKDKVKEADVPDKVRACSGHLSVGDGVMLLAGIYGAALHDGESWQMIIDFGELD